MIMHKGGLFAYLNTYSALEVDHRVSEGDKEAAKVFEDTGADVTEMFIEGARKAVEFARQKGVKVAILTDGSPSCGSTYVYDGNFTGKTIPGKGVTAELMEQNGIKVFSENQIEDAQDFLNNLEDSELESENSIR